MNAFADTLLSMMFGWLRRLVESIFSSASSGSFSSFLSWLGDHWFWLVAVLCVVCLVLDYFIWLIRWKPYVIWRNKLRRLFGRRDRTPSDPVFDQGYDTGVDLDMDDMEAAPVPEYAAWQPEYEMPVQPQQPAPLPQFVQEVEPVYTAAEASDPQLEEFIYLPPETTVRNRRSRRYEKKKSLLSGLLSGNQEEESEMIDGLPPVVNKEDAFHAPVFPDQYQNE